MLVYVCGRILYAVLQHGVRRGVYPVLLPCGMYAQLLPFRDAVAATLRQQQQQQHVPSLPRGYQTHA